MKTGYLLLLVGGFATAAAAGAAPESTQLLACYKLPDPGARLQCFDRAVAPLAQQAGASNPAPVTAALPPPPPVSQPLGQEQLKQSKETQTAQESMSLNAHIASLRRGGQGTYLVTLDNGQVWRHEDSAQAEYLVVGEAVTISRASLGSYRLTRDAGKAKNWIRVTRLR